MCIEYEVHLKSTRRKTTEKDVEREIVENRIWYHKIITTDKIVWNEILKLLSLPREWSVEPKTSMNEINQDCLEIKLTCNAHLVDKVDNFAKDLAGSKKVYSINVKIAAVFLTKILQLSTSSC